jgi:hypothetical protein
MSSSTPVTDDDGVSVQTLVAVVVLLALVLAFALGVYALTPAGQRPQLVDDAKVYVPALIAGVPGLLAALRIRRVHAQNVVQSSRLATIERQTNGELKQNVGEVVAQVFDQKIAARRATDPAPDQRAGTAADRRAPAKPKTAKTTTPSKGKS